MASNDNDFLRLGRNFTVSPIPLSALRTDRKRTIMATFTELVSTGSPPETRRVFLRPSSGNIKLIPSYGKCRKRLREYPSVLTSVIKDVIEPSGAEFGVSTSLNLQKRVKTGSSGQDTTINSPSKSREIKEEKFPDSDNNQLQGNLINAEWTCDGSYCIICCHQGVTVANPHTMSYTAVCPGAFCRVACHPTLPNTFAGVLGSTSIAVYEIIEKPSTKGGTTCILKIAADLKFKNVKLSDSVLCWDPSGSYLIVCRQDMDFFLVSFGNPEKSSQVDIHPCTPSPDVDLGFAAPSAKEPSKVRRDLKVITQERLERRTNCATFLKIAKTHRDERTAKKQKKNESDVETNNEEDSSTYLCLGQEGGNLAVYKVNTHASSPSSSMLSHSWNLRCAWGHILSIKADPNGLFVFVGSDDATLSIIDLESRTTVSTIQRAFGAIKHISLSPTGTFAAWSAEVSNTVQLGPALDSSLNKLKPFISLVTTAPLEILWKMESPAGVKSLSWHPTLPVILYTYETYGYVRPTTSSQSWSAIERDKIGTTPSEPPAQGVGLISFSSFV